MKQENIKQDATVIEDLSNSLFRCELDNGFIVKCTISGKIRINNIRIMVHDRVQLEMSPFDLTNGRIVYRYRPGETSNNRTDDFDDKKKKNKNKSKPNKKR